MNKSLCTYSEQEIIDYILAKLPEAKAQEINGHLEHCETCRLQFDDWTHVLGPASDTDPIMPSKSLRRKLKMRYLFQHWLPAFCLRPTIAISTIGVVASILVMVGLFNLYAAPADSSKSGINQEMSIVMKPKTVQYNVVPKSKTNVKGYVWINRDSHEMLFLVKGITPSSEKDYQVWFIKKQVRSNGGLLRWENGMGQLYHHGGEIEGIENIAVSIEPKGGSHTPTSPDEIFVDLKNGKPNTVH